DTPVRRARCSYLRRVLGHCVLRSLPTRRSSDLAQATCVAGSTGLLPVEPAACEGTHTVSPSPSVRKALPPFCRDTMFSTAARKPDRKSTRLNSSHVKISYAVFCLKKNKYFPFDR